MNALGKVGWGVVGCGWVARDYVLPAMRESPLCRLVACCDPDPEALQQVAGIIGDARQCTRLSELLDTPGLDAVYIATPNHLHGEIAIQTARSGRHVLCEKPMAVSYAEAESMVRECTLNRVTYATAFDQRFQARHIELRKMIQRRELGDITSARIHYACWTPPEWQPATAKTPHDHWRIDPRRAGGGSFFDLAPHGLDLIQVLLNERIRDLHVRWQQRIFNYPVDDGAAFLGTSESGVLVSGQVAYNCPELLPRRTLEIYGTAGCAIATNTMGQTNGGHLHFIDARSGIRQEVRISDDPSPFTAGLNAFSYALLSGESFPFSPEQDLHTMKLLTATE